MPSWKKVITSGSNAVLNSVTATTGFTGSLLGTASYATQALSASYAPGGGNPFPYNGNAQISGSLGVTGSFAVQTYDSFISNAYVNAIQITDTYRTIYDIFGNTSIDAGGRILTDMNALPSANWMARTLFDSSPSPSINWGFRYLYNSSGSISLNWASKIAYDTSTSSSIKWDIRQLWDADPFALGYNTASLDWANRLAYDANAFPSIDWNYRRAYDGANVLSIDYGHRNLITPNGTIAALNWGDDTYLDSNVYQRDYKSADIQDAVSNNYNDPAASYLGDVIEVDGTIFIGNYVTDGMLVYLETNATWYPVEQASTVSTKLLGIAHNVGFNGANTGWVLLEGHVVIDDTSTSGPNVQSPDHGLPIYIKNNTTTGLMSTVVPTTTSGTNVVRVLGHCYQQNAGTTSQWMMKFRPSNDWVVI